MHLHSGYLLSTLVAYGIRHVRAASIPGLCGNSTQQQYKTDCQPEQKPLVTTDTLISDIRVDKLTEGAHFLQGYAKSSNNTRAIGTPGHVATLKYIEDLLSRSGAYDVKSQYFDAYEYTRLGNSTVVINGQTPEFITPEYSPGGSVKGSIVYSKIGCSLGDFPSAVAGQIALIDRGSCDFGLKVALAGKAGALGVILAASNDTTPDIPYDETYLGEPTRPEGSYVPTIAVSKNYGSSIRENSIGSFTVLSETAKIRTSNIIAETKSGDHNNVVALGAHTDCVPAGPGINDNGSGLLTLLEVAERLAGYEVTNAVRFCFWSAEELGSVGSYHYADSLDEAEIRKIRMYLNFDMLASPNYGYFIYDGDKESLNLGGHAGSVQIEISFKKYFDTQKLFWDLVDVTGRSDQSAFTDLGIPTGGLYSGSDEIKTAGDVARWGGIAGTAYDSCYHQACDTTTNLANVPWFANTRAIAYAVATYASSLEGFPANNATAPASKFKRDIAVPRSIRPTIKQRML